MFNIDMLRIFGKVDRVFYDDKKKIVGFVSERENFLSFKFKNKVNYLMLKNSIIEQKEKNLEV